MYSQIAGTGSKLPARVVSNAELETMVETSDEWIVSRTGIKTRHIISNGETNLDLAEGAVRNAMEMAGVTPRRSGPDYCRHHDTGTSLPEYGMPATTAHWNS